MLNSAHQARKRTLKILSETDKYVSGVNEDGKTILYYLIKQVKYEYSELNRALGEMDNILPQYGDTSAKNEMLELRGRLEDRERTLHNMLDKK